VWLSPLASSLAVLSFAVTLTNSFYFGRYALYPSPVAGRRVAAVALSGINLALCAEAFLFIGLSRHRAPTADLTLAAMLLVRFGLLAAAAFILILVLQSRKRGI
jgi:hypothetical protein